MFDGTLVDLSNVFERQNVINRSIVENENIMEGGEDNFLKNRELNFNDKNEEQNNYFDHLVNKIENYRSFQHRYEEAEKDLKEVKID